MIRNVRRGRLGDYNSCVEAGGFTAEAAAACFNSQVVATSPTPIILQPAPVAGGSGASVITLPPATAGNQLPDSTDPAPAGIAAELGALPPWVKWAAAAAAAWALLGRK